MAINTPVQATEEGYPEVTVYINCSSTTHLMGISATIVGVPAQSQLQASYNIGGGTEHSLGVVWTGQLGIGSTNTEAINSPYPDQWVNVTIGGYHGRKMSKPCP